MSSVAVEAFGLATVSGAFFAGAGSVAIVGDFREEALGPAVAEADGCTSSCAPNETKVESSVADCPLDGIFDSSTDELKFDPGALAVVADSGASDSK
jgi:hypothetical protein